MYANRDIKAYGRAKTIRTASHSFRVDPHNLNVDYSRTKNNVIVFGAKSLDEYHQMLNDKIELTSESRKGRRVRSDANLVINQVFNASPEFFFDFKKCGITREQWQNLDPTNNNDKKKIKEVWETLNIDNLEKYQQIIIDHLGECHKHTISLVLHLDEKTPHWHASSVPIVINKDGKEALSAKQYYTKKTLSLWNEDFKKRINKLGLSFSKPLADVSLDVDEHKVLEKVSKPNPVSNRRLKPHKPEKKMGILYTEDEVRKTIQSYEDREKNLKEIIASLKDWRKKNEEQIRDHHNLKLRHEKALKELQRLREYKRYTRNYRSLVSKEKKMRLEIEQQKEQILELKKEREELLKELHELKPEQKITLNNVHKNIENMKNSTTLNNMNKRGYTP